jgi:hypothetical protein
MSVRLLERDLAEIVGLIFGRIQQKQYKTITLAFVCCSGVTGSSLGLYMPFFKGRT